MVDTNQCCGVLRKQLHQPLRNSTAGPIFFEPHRRWDFTGWRDAIRDIHPQSWEARLRRLSAGVIYADVAIECHAVSLVMPTAEMPPKVSP